MEQKPKILFWINGFFLHFSLAYYLQSILNAEFFGIIDINSKPKEFFQSQKLVNFEKKWYFHDYINKNYSQNPDLDYLSNFEKKYDINLAKLAINERFFYKFNRFYKFKNQEILCILEQEIKLFESILDEIQPDVFLTYDPVFHHQKLLLDMCRSKGIKVLSICSLGFKNKFLLAEDGATFDLDSSQINNYSNFQKINHVNPNNSNLKNDSRDLSINKWIQERNKTTSQKFSALKDYLLVPNSDLVKTNFMYYGRTKSKVIKDALFFEIKRKQNFKFIQKNSVLEPDLKRNFVYFPMNIDEEMSLLHYAPFFTDQIEVIRHIAKSIPIDYVLYVKEHIVAGQRGWNNKNYYKEISEIPNVVLIHPHVNNEILLKNSKLLITIRGTSPLKAMQNGTPSIVFGDQPFQIMPSVFKLDSLVNLPELINKALVHQTNRLDFEIYEKIIDERSFIFDITDYEIRRDKMFFSGEIFSNVKIDEKNMLDFLNNNKTMFLDLIDAHMSYFIKE